MTHRRLPGILVPATKAESRKTSYLASEWPGAWHLCRAVTWFDAVLAQNGPQSLQLSVHPGEFLGQG